MPYSADTAQKLYNILRLERERGFDNAAVIGGLDGFLQESGAELAPIVEGMEGYGSLTPEQRSGWANRAVKRMRAQGGVIFRTDATARRAQDVPRPHSQSKPKLPKAKPTPASAKPPRKPREPARPIELSDQVSRVRGVNRRLLPLLEKIRVATVGDLMQLYPSRHSDYTNVRKVAQLAPGDDQTAILTVWEANQTMLGRQRSTQAVLGDDTGIVRATWFNQPWLAKTLRRGSKVVLSGKVGVYRGGLVFQSPEYEIVGGDDGLTHTGRLVPVYPSTQGLNQRTLRSVVRRSLDACLDQVDEFLPDDVLHRAGLIGLRTAIEQMHYPDDFEMHRRARRRLAFDELFLLQLSIFARRADWKQTGGAVPLDADPDAIDAFLSTLPFDLTTAQTRALADILADIQSDRAMSRLLQGDVGSGKTVVATAAMLAAARSGTQAALMAPTEILAEQHFLTVCGLLDGPGFQPAGGDIHTLDVAGLDRRLTVALLVGAQRKRVRDDIVAMLSAGLIDIVIGTHALIQRSVDIPNLSLAIVDEQHRFGVSQRAALRQKGVRPHVLAMSATPIPRSLAMTMYGDLDVSVIDELPPGRLPVRTRFVENERRDQAYEFVRAQIELGRQAFVVCPLIDESEVVQTKAAQEEYDRLSNYIYPDKSVGLLHGRMSLLEKEQVMNRVKAGEIDVLVATTVIEVGIDVPNATVMFIDGAERFGLSQLHQLRGRVGRGEHQSHCLLLSESPGADALNRLKLLERISDGFALAEEDLKLRGAGDYLGTRQSGLPPFRVAQITDQDIIALARREASRISSADPNLSRDENSALGRRFARYDDEHSGERS